MQIKITQIKYYSYDSMEFQDIVIWK